MSKSIVKDSVNQELAIGDLVAWCPYKNTVIQSCEIIGFTEQMVKVKRLKGYYKDQETNVFPNRLVKYKSVENVQD